MNAAKLESAIVTWTPDALAYRETFYKEIWTHLRPAAIDRAASLGRSEVRKEDLEACLRDVVLKALEACSDA
jgi:hypothetical protein